MAKQEPVAITGVWLDAFGGQMTVRVEIDGKWRDVINEQNHGGHTSHIVEPLGMRARPVSDVYGG